MTAAVTKKKQPSNNKQNTRPKKNGCLTFHRGTQANLIKFVVSNAPKNDPKSMVDIIDQFCWKHQWMMNIGDEKGAFLDKAIVESQPKYILELGTYCGYSAIRMLSNLVSKSKSNKNKNVSSKNNNNTNDGNNSGFEIEQNCKLFTIEINEKAQATAQKLFNYCGLHNNITILNGSSDSILPKLRSEILKKDKNFKYFDVVFIDHAKERYLADLLIIEKLNLINSGSYVVADNVIVFQINDYLNHVRHSGRYSSSVLYESNMEYDNDNRFKDGVEISIYK